MTEPKTPWLAGYGDVPFHLTYSDASMSDTVLRTAAKYPDNEALSFMGKKTPYKVLAPRIIEAAKALKALGVKEGETVTICMPNVPQAVICLYALNYIGAVASMVHPLSAVGEIEFYLKETGSRIAITLNMFYKKFKEVMKEVKLEHLIIADLADELSALKRFGYKLTSGRKIDKVPQEDPVLFWDDFIKGADKITEDCAAHKKPDDTAVILFSGGTTGKTKGILLTNLNFNALALQTATMCHREITGTRMLAAMPVFHGFGLGVCIHTMMVAGGSSILVPKFNVKSYAKLLKSEQPNFIAGVPTLYESLTRNPFMDKIDLSCLMGVFSGGDSLSIELKKKLDKFLADHHATVKVREGYGTTECVTASCLTPYNKEKEGSIGFPYPDTYYAICKPGTTEEVPYGTDGEICLCGPSVMKGYLNNPEETADTLKLHADGHIWLHTGDLGFMDDEGFIFFKQRIKRMIITSGYNVYPSQIENVIDSHPAVQMSCVIGVKDPYKMQKVKAFVVLRPGFEPSDKIKDEIMAICRQKIAKYALPYEIEIRDALPKTLVGKIAYTVLEKEESQKAI